ncbi:hypothetical protein D0865_05678 [Hortaea werneckii]|uniref:Uncharacterized protein n=1 Tax=Hortaea werneckii TaxID=91943 RepID=A0A3M7CLW6_HORWE|nr:hypothetical protein D0865_05678 [Hortaea werneckii]
MNCPSRTDPELPDEYNQNPSALAGDTTTRSDLNRIANARLQRDHRLRKDDANVETLSMEQQGSTMTVEANRTRKRAGGSGSGHGGGHHLGEEMVGETFGSEPHNYAHTQQHKTGKHRHRALNFSSGNDPASPDPNLPWWRRTIRKTALVLMKYSKFVGPGFMVSVAYIDPGNYSTDVAAGASYRFKLLFMILLSNIFAIFLQSLCIKLGTVTGLNLAEMCRAEFPKWLNYFLYIFAEAAIIATDIAEVIGTAIALNLLSGGKIPLVAGCAISIADVLFILLFYRPNQGSMRALRLFETFVAFLVIGVVVCFCWQLSKIEGVSVREVFRGYAPSSALVEGKALYQACGILGATVMPHSLYLGSGIIQARLKDFDAHHPENLRLADPPSNRHNANASASPPTEPPPNETEDDDTLSTFSTEKYRPTIYAIKSCMSYSIAELAISLFTFALFVNSSILIVAGASLSTVSGASDATLFGIYHLLAHSLAPAAGTVFALALLLSGISAGIVCTIAGQMVSEGQLSLRMRPWQRRLLTRSISVIPSIIVAAASGREGINKALNGSQFALSVILPFVSAPLIWFTSRAKFMSVRTGVNPEVVGAQGQDQGGSGGGESHGGGELGVVEGGGSGDGTVQMKNHWVTVGFALVIWLLICIMNVASLVLAGLGVE